MGCLDTDIKLFTAALLQARIIIRKKDGVVVSCGNSIQCYTPFTVKIGGLSYIRSEFDFVVYSPR
ncbi:hypothetical protein PDUR_22085 [Paenibacillus durus]|uniref:Uncharacterized protein n=1 Tax=Paenibacillus durus TaxID=44251 RepID=A0A089HT70_PAEDU|nr:hypothetical protein PDUR_22085 [Paenibacillus durus]